MTVDDVAEATGLNRKSIIHAENAAVVPSVVTLMLIADALGVTLSELTDYGPAAATGGADGGA
jgi:transcriptional regulator with XRE-family HTH domain